MRKNIKFVVIELMALVFGVLFASCNPIDTVEYEYSITYTIEGSQYTEKGTMDMPRSYVPSYGCRDGRITLYGAGQGFYQIYYKDIYSGSLSVSVQSFDYVPVRTYKVSRLDGTELKK